MGTQLGTVALATLVWSLLVLVGYFCWKGRKIRLQLY